MEKALANRSEGGYGAGRVLVLDDEESYARMLVDFLRHRHFDATMALNPSEGLKALRQNRFDLIVADFSMPEANGAEFAADARAIDADLPVILISGVMGTSDLVRAANENITLVLQKPFNLLAFCSDVDRLVKIRRPGQPARDRPPASDCTTNPNSAEVSSKACENLDHLAGRSAQGKWFIEQFWEVSRERSLILVAAREGSELELMSQELASWDGFTDEPVFACTQGKFREVMRESYRKHLNADPLQEQFSVVLVTGFDSERSLASSDFPELVKEWAEHAKTERIPKIVCHLIAKAGNPPFIPPPESNKIASQTDRIIEVPPLHTRLADLAYYSNRLLNACGEGALRLSLAGASAILRDPWPGEYAELAECLQRAAELQTGSTIEVQDLENALKPLRGNDFRMPTDCSMDDFLLHKQEEIVAQFVNDPFYVNKLQMEVSDIPFDLIPKARKEQGKSMIFPELAQ